MFTYKFKLVYKFFTFFVFVIFYSKLSNGKECVFFRSVCAASYCAVTSTLRCSQKDGLFLIFLDFETHFSAKVPVQISNLGLNRILSTRAEFFQWRSIDFLSSIKS